MTEEGAEKITAKNGGVEWGIDMSWEAEWKDSEIKMAKVDMSQ